MRASMESRMHEASSSARDLFAAKVACGIFRPVARHLREDLREDRLAEGIGLTFEVYQRYAERGVFIDDALLVHACRLRAIDLGRHVAHGAQSKRDVLDERNYHEGKVEVLHLGLEPGEDDGWIGFAPQLNTNPTSHIVSAISLERWLSSLPPRDRLILSLRQAGHPRRGIGLQTGSSTSAVFQRLRELGTELAHRLGRTQ